MLNDLPGLFSQFFSGGGRGGHPAFLELQDWVSELAKHAVQKWGIAMLSQMPCGCMARCSRIACGACVICRKPTCLGHSFTSSDGYLACHACVHAASTAGGQTPPPNRGPRERSAPSSAADDEDTEALRRKHLKTLKLKLDATEDDVKAAWKKFVAKNHPDKASEDKREAATKRFVEVKTAYEWLIANAARKAA